MAGCDAHNSGGDNDASKKRVAVIAAIFAGLGALGVLLAGLGFFGWTVLLAMLLGAIAGGAFGFFVGSAWDWSRRLKVQSPRTITISGNVKCAGRNPFGLQPFTDGDWTCNMGDLKHHLPTDLAVTAPGATTQTEEVRMRAAPGSGLAHAFLSFNEKELKHHILHCELSSHIGNYSVVGGAVGSAVGLAAGVGVGIAICVAAGIFTFGIGAALCLLIIAALAALGAVGGGVAGDAAGAVAGWIADELSDWDKLGKTIESDSLCTLFITGRWVTDISHQHNEIHDIGAVQIASCHPIETVLYPQHENTVATVAIARVPAGNPPIIK